MSNSTAPKVLGVPRPDGAAAGASGEGADSALQAMLKKRQLRIDPSTDQAAPSPSPAPGVRQTGRARGK